jgi:hypothetical protein
VRGGIPAPAEVSTSADRMRARRARLAEQGLAEATVVWPEHRLDELRELAEAAQHQHERLLLDGGWPGVEPEIALERALQRRQSQTD